MSNDTVQLEKYLRDTLDDLRLSDGERRALRALGEDLTRDQLNFMRNKAFFLVREQVARAPETRDAMLEWLELVVKTLEAAGTPTPVMSSAYFSPGEECRQKVCAMLRGAAKKVDICVFTITDDGIADEILEAHQRGVAIRVITDDEKSHDGGSDVLRLRDRGIRVVMDNSPYYMHHKFALFDSRQLLNGSFNWTRSASDQNQENIVVTDDPTLVEQFQSEFEALWKQFSGNRRHFS